MKLYHGTFTLSPLECEDLTVLKSEDGMIHFHTYPATTTGFADNVVVCDSDFELDDLFELPDLKRWNGAELARELEERGIITEQERIDHTVRGAYNYTDTKKTRQSMLNLLKSKGIPAFKYENKYEDVYGQGYSVAVFDTDAIHNPEYYYPGHGRDRALKTATTLVADAPDPPFNYSGYKRDQALKDVIDQYREYRKDNPPWNPEDNIHDTWLTPKQVHLHTYRDDIKQSVLDYESKSSRDKPAKLDKSPKYQQRHGRGRFRR